MTGAQGSRKLPLRLPLYHIIAKNMKKLIALAVIVSNLYAWKNMDFHNLSAMDGGILVSAAALLVAVVYGMVKK